MSKNTGTLQNKNGDILYPANIETVTNSNGTALKFPDGTLICYKRVHYDKVPIKTSWGALYDNGNSIELGDWAVSFIDTPATTIDCQAVGGHFPEGHQQVSKTSAGSCWIVRGKIGEGTGYISVVGFGRWK